VSPELGVSSSPRPHSARVSEYSLGLGPRIDDPLQPRSPRNRVRDGTAPSISRRHSCTDLVPDVGRIPGHSKLSCGRRAVCAAESMAEPRVCRERSSTTRARPRLVPEVLQPRERIPLSNRSSDCGPGRRTSLWCRGPDRRRCTHDCGSRRCARCRPDPRQPASAPGSRSRGQAATLVKADLASGLDESQKRGAGHRRMACTYAQLVNRLRRHRRPWASQPGNSKRERSVPFHAEGQRFDRRDGPRRVTGPGEDRPLRAARRWPYTDKERNGFAERVRSVRRPMVAGRWIRRAMPVRVEWPMLG
jgi:hypothetical protein